MKWLQSHPVWVRGLKHISIFYSLTSHLSHPVWVRGLKLTGRAIIVLFLVVAPRVGAWIETMAHRMYPVI